MGVNNRQRRAAKAKQRAQSRGGRPGSTSRTDAWNPYEPRRSTRGDESDEPPLRRSSDEEVRRLLHLCIPEHRAPARPGTVRTLVDQHPEPRVDRVVERELLAGVALLWEHGWQPAELVRRVRRADARAGRLALVGVAADHVPRPPAGLHPRWAAQLDQLDLPTVPSTGWLAEFGRSEGISREVLLTAAVAVLASIYSASPLRVIVPPPGASPRSLLDRGPSVDDPVLVRVRALLAQAESTTFEAEAATFTAKAQQLIARHAIDMAMLWADSPRDEQPITIRIPIDDPYANIKSYLLQCVAKRMRCAAAYDDANAMSTVIGFASDLAATEMLFTSLLVQSQAALQAEGVRGGPGSRHRSRNFRSSFLMAFTGRVDERLARINAEIEGEVSGRSGGHAVLPVLASRSAAVQEKVDELFGTLQMSTVRGGSDALGWSSGRLAGDLAKLNAADLAGDAGTDDGGEGGPPMLPC